MQTKSIREWAKEVHQVARSKGWHPRAPMESGALDVALISSWLCLIHSEVSEALEDLRVINPRQIPILELQTITRAGDGKPLGFASEMADIVIRVMDVCSALGIDLEEAIYIKNEYNKTRPERHGGKSL
jgi:NTP pyrophosphatase (non-canonical NTP hydrolase)